MRTSTLQAPGSARGLWVWIAVLSLVPGFSQGAQAQPTFDWAIGGGGPGFDIVRGLAVDDTGDLYVTGQFQTQLDLDGDGTVELTSSDGQGDGFVARYDPAGQLLWFAHIDAIGEAFAQGKAVSVHPDGNVYVAGSFDSQVDFDGDGTADITENGGGGDFYLAAYSPGGAWLWARRLGGPDIDVLEDLAIDSEGHIVLAGWFSNHTDLDDDGIADLNGNGVFDGFIASFDVDGALLWARVALGFKEGEDDVRVFQLVTDEQGDIIGAGTFDGSGIDFDGDGEADLEGGVDPTAGNVFVAAYATSGTLSWARAIVSLQDPSLAPTVDFGGLALGVDGHPTVSGSFNRDLDFDGDGVADAETSDFDFFLAQYDASGNPLGLQAGGGPGVQASQALTTDIQGNLYLAGRFRDAIDLDGDGTPEATNTGELTPYLAGLDASGDLLWFSGFNAGSITDLVTSDDGQHLYLGGFLTGSIDFDGDGAADVVGGEQDLFVAKFTLEAPADLIPPALTLHNPLTLWPPNGQTTALTITDMVASVSDEPGPVDLPVADVVITHVTSDEAAAAGDVVLGPDCRSVALRARRDGGGNGRLYRVHVAATDAAGNVGTAAYRVSVPHDQGRGAAAVDDGVTAVVEGPCTLPALAGRATTEKGTASQAGEAPSAYALGGNYPNPFNPSTTITYALPEAGWVLLAVYNLQGRRVATLVEGFRPAGEHRVRWEAGGLASGVYLYRMQAGAFVTVRRLTLLR